MPVTLTDAIRFVGKVRVERKLYKGQFNLVLYSAYEPCNINTHATLMKLGQKWYGKVGTRMPKSTKHEEHSYEFIVSAFPEAVYGKKAGGDIYGIPK